MSAFFIELEFCVCVITRDIAFFCGWFFFVRFEGRFPDKWYFFPTAFFFLQDKKRNRSVFFLCQTQNKLGCGGVCVLGVKSLFSFFFRENPQF